MMQRLKERTYGTWKKSLQFKQDNRRKKNPRRNHSGSNKDWKAKSR